MFIDVSSALACSPEDVIGPFGFFEDSSTQRRWIESYSGFSIQSSKESFYFKDFFLSSVYKKRVSFSSLTSPSHNRKDFQVMWIHHLMSQLSSSIEISEGQVRDSSYVFKDFGVLKPPVPVEKLLKNEVVLSKNLDWKWDAEKRVLFRENKEEIQVENIILLLNPEELHHFNPDWSSSFFFKDKESTRWSWQRFLFQFDDEGYPFPSHLVLVDPEDLPWTHERLLCLKSSLIEKNKMDIWGLFPAHYSEVEFKECVERIHHKLNQLLPRFSWNCIQKSFVTPSFLFPVYSPQSVKKMKFVSSAFYGWPMQDMSENGWLKQEERIFQQISH